MNPNLLITEQENNPTISAILNFGKINLLWKKKQREKCPNTEFFLVRIFPYWD